MNSDDTYLKLLKEVIANSYELGLATALNGTTNSEQFITQREQLKTSIANLFRSEFVDFTPQTLNELTEGLK